jgi:hypothetical protein
MSYQIKIGDCLESMRGMADDSVDAIVTDPPYGLSFMGKKWDYDVPQVEVWREALRVLKPGGHLLAFAGTRTQHRMAVNIEDAGFEIRDMIAWVYGSGFPKSLNIGKAVDKLQGNEREFLEQVKRTGKESGTFGAFAGNNIVTKGTSEWEGWGTALKPALEPITVARKPFKGTVASNVLEHGTGAINVDATRVGYENDKDRDGMYRPESRGGLPNEFNACNVIQSKPSKLGRWPANLIHDGSDEVVGLFPVTTSGGGVKANKGTVGLYGIASNVQTNFTPDTGSAARFFYVAKASKRDRNEGLPEGQTSSHPTVKPTALMQYLCRLVTPPNGTILDPYMGSGSTGKAAMLEGFSFIGCEMDAEYAAIADARIQWAVNQKQGELSL